MAISPSDPDREQPLTLTEVGVGGGLWTALHNQHLDELLRERPGDLDRIISYIEERGMDPKQKTPVNRLREWLDDAAPSLGGGWI